MTSLNFLNYGQPVATKALKTQLPLTGEYCDNTKVWLNSCSKLCHFLHPLELPRCQTVKRQGRQNPLGQSLEPRQNHLDFACLWQLLQWWLLQRKQS